MLLMALIDFSSDVFSACVEVGRGRISFLVQSRPFSLRPVAGLPLGDIERQANHVSVSQDAMKLDCDITGIEHLELVGSKRRGSRQNENVPENRAASSPPNNHPEYPAFPHRLIREGTGMTTNKFATPLSDLQWILMVWAYLILAKPPSQECLLRFSISILYTHLSHSTCDVAQFACCEPKSTGKSAPK